jgi:hypothetical protein
VYLRLLTKYNQELYRILEMREKTEEMQECILVIAPEKVSTIKKQITQLRNMLAAEDHETSIIEQQNDQLV